MAKNNVCGMCGQVGHNRRTCGKTYPQPQKTPKPAYPVTQSIETGGEPSGWNRTFAALEEKTKNFTPHPPPIQAEETFPPTSDSVFTAEELSTWWLLANEEYPKKKRHLPEIQHDAQQLKMFLQTIPENTIEMTSPVVWREFLQKFPQKVREYAVGESKKQETTSAYLSILAHDPDSTVRWWVAENHNTSPAILKILSTDVAEDVRLEVLYNPSCPVEVITRAAEEKEENSLLGAHARGILKEKKRTGTQK